MVLEVKQSNKINFKFNIVLYKKSNLAMNK